MKKIQPFNIWVNGKTLVACYMTLVCNNDNLLNQAVFYWSFLDEQGGKPGNKIADGNITMTGKSYDDWATNNEAWDWAASQLGVTLIP
jgi:hypothetical protein